ncbi:hemerythrin domain-containing protein [Dactylosporangium vinaceum]|uniref:Hemerythrin domain-containing protein n=1 Tax=Dactylosporangium vinaceum TaxID=53362 RepID=A0ABV5MIM0_9ACTN|nr:hemerythrin domain-containing protein [Dactylosporangium vinaceum]
MSGLPLPPLPPIDGDATGRSMLDLLDEEHRQLDRLCTRAESSPAASEVLVATLARHLSAEEQYLYPAFEGVLPDAHDVVERELAADAELLVALRRLHTSADRTALHTVAEQVRSHTHRTTADVFPALRTHCTDDELVRLGNRVEIARSAAPTRPHPGTPSTPPLNKLVDPALGVMDKLRDALTRRTTWEEDL